MVATVHPRPAELLQRMAGGDLYDRAYRDGMNLSAFLEREDPTDAYPAEERGLDAFGRMLKAAGIKTQSDPAAGYYADEFKVFDQDDNTRALVPEWMARQWRKVSFRQARGPQSRAVFTSADDIPGTSMKPWVDATPRMSQLAPAIPLAELVAITTPIDSDVYRAFYFTDDAASVRKVRVSEGAEIPRATISGGEHTINLHKYGRVIETSYEFLRRQRIDKVAFWVQRSAIQAEMDKVAAAITVLINGDGNSGTAATSHNGTTLDAAMVAGTLSLKAWLNFKLQFTNPYAITAAFVQSATALQMMLLNVGSANVPLVTIQGAAGFGGFTPINPELADNVRLGITSEAPTLKIVGVDTRFALERVTEIGSDLEEVQRWSTRQTQTLTLTEVEGYAILDSDATHILDVAA